eukprot:6199144-Pleurochrysis_carterae.AAC.1
MSRYSARSCCTSPAVLPRATIGLTGGFSSRMEADGISTSGSVRCTFCRGSWHHCGCWLAGIAYGSVSCGSKAKRLDHHTRAAQRAASLL